MPIFHEFPYGNTHDQNYDWILQVVKDFQSKYTNFDQTVDDALNAIEAAKDGSLEDMQTALTNALTAIAADQATAQAAIATDQATAQAAIATDQATAQAAIATDKDAVLLALQTALTAAITSITTEQTNATQIIEQLYNTLPASAQDILGRLRVLDTIITGYTPSNSFQWLQGSYIYPEGVTPPTPPAINSTSETYNKFVSSRYMEGVAGQRIRITTDGSIIISVINIWTSNPPGGAPSQFITGELEVSETYADVILPLNVTAFSIQLAGPTEESNIEPTDIPGHIDVRWVTDFVGQATIAPKETSNTANVARETGELFFLDGVLYRALDDIAVGDTIVTSGAGANCAETTIDNELQTNKDAINKINSDIYISSTAEYATDSTYPLGFRSGFFSSAGLSRVDSGYSRNAKGIVIDKSCNSIRIIPKTNTRLNYCIFSSEPNFSNSADNSSILLANGGSFRTGERFIINPPAGLLYVSHEINVANLTSEDRPTIILTELNFSTDKEYSTLGYTRDYTDITGQLNFERKQITEANGIEDSTTHVIAKLPNIGCIEVRMNTPAGKFAVFKDANGTITKLCDYTTYQYRLFADYVSDYYIDITNINVTTLTVDYARKYVLTYLYDDSGEYRRTTYMNKLSGMSIAFIGDSITQGRFHKTGTDEDVDGTNFTMCKPYPVLVAEICGDQNVINYGIGGALVYNNNWKSLYLNCENISGYDYVFVHAGTNDYGSNVSSEDFTNAYNHVISTLKAHNTNVVVLTPITRTNRTGANTQNMYLADYADIEKTIAEQQSCKVIDLLTLTNNDTFKSLLSDGLHPNEIGHAYIADLILKGL